MRPFLRSCLSGLLISGLLNFPTFAANEKALGVVIQSQIGRLGNASVAIGTSVYPGDGLWTDVGGTLRIKVGTGQLYLLSSSAMSLGKSDDWVQATITRGTAGFSANYSDHLELIVPQGAIRPAEGPSANGQVTIISPVEIIVSAYRGALILDNAGEVHVIEAGKSYRVTILPDDEQKPEGSATQEYPETKMKHPKKRHLAFELLLVGLAGAGSYFLYEQLTESPSNFN